MTTLRVPTGDPTKGYYRHFPILNNHKRCGTNVAIRRLILVWGGDGLVRLDHRELGRVRLLRDPVAVATPLNIRAFVSAI